MKDSRLEKLREFDTPSITNVVATYPGKDYCLGLYDPWVESWYTNQKAKVIYPNLKPVAGYAVTCTYGLPDPEYQRLSFSDVLKAVDSVNAPVILIVKQQFPKRIKNKNGLLGGNMMTALKSLGVVGVISDGPSRDIDEIRPLNMQYMLSGVCPGHGKWALKSINTPVKVFDMMVAPGDIVHMDENGAVKFPADYLDEVIERAEKLSVLESNRQKKMRETTDVEKIIDIMAGIYD